MNNIINAFSDKIAKSDFICQDLPSIQSIVTNCLKATGSLVCLICVTQFPSGPFNYTMNFLRVSALIQAVVCAAALPLATNEWIKKNNNTIHEVGMQFRVNKLRTDMLIPFKGLWNGVDYLLVWAGNKCDWKIPYFPSWAVSYLCSPIATYLSSRSLTKIREDQVRAMIRFYEGINEKPKLTLDRSAHIKLGLKCNNIELASCNFNEILNSVWLMDQSSAQTNKDSPIPKECKIIAVNDDSLDEIEKRRSSRAKKTIQYPLPDDPRISEDNYKAIAIKLLEAAREAAKEIEAGKCCTVHCRLGVNRSATAIALALYLVYNKRCGLTLDCALWIVKASKHTADPLMDYLYIFSRMEDLIYAPTSLNDNLLPLSDSSLIPGAGNIIDSSLNIEQKKDLNTFLTLDVCKYIQFAEKNNFNEIKKNEPLSSPLVGEDENLSQIEKRITNYVAGGGSLLLDPKLNKKPIIKEYFSNCDEKDPLSVLLNLSKNDIELLKKN